MWDSAASRVLYTAKSFYCETQYDESQDTSSAKYSDMLPFRNNLLNLILAGWLDKIWMENLELWWKFKIGMRPEIILFSQRLSLIPNYYSMLNILNIKNAPELWLRSDLFASPVLREWTRRGSASQQMPFLAPRAEIDSQFQDNHIYFLDYYKAES